MPIATSDFVSDRNFHRTTIRVYREWSQKKLWMYMYTTGGHAYSSSCLTFEQLLTTFTCQYNNCAYSTFHTKYSFPKITFTVQRHGLVRQTDRQTDRETYTQSKDQTLYYSHQPPSAKVVPAIQCCTHNGCQGTSGLSLWHGLHLWSSPVPKLHNNSTHKTISKEKNNEMWNAGWGGGREKRW